MACGYRYFPLHIMIFSRLSRFFEHQFIRQLLNAGLRLVSLGSKLLLTLFMGKFLGLTEMGTYGLVAAYVAIAIPLLGMKLDYAVSREIVDIQPPALVCKLRDQFVLYAINYGLFAVLGLIGAVLWPDLIEPRLALLAIILAIVESVGAVTGGNLVSLKQPLSSTILFFIRSALWVFPVMIVAWLIPELRTANVIFMFWLAGAILSLLLTAWLWRGLPWRHMLSVRVDWAWIWASVKLCLPIWVGAVAAAGAGNLDRFVVEVELGRDFVGIISFYGSFAVAQAALVQNGVVAFSYPRLVGYFRSGDHKAFRAEAVRMTIQCSLGVAVVAAIIGIIVPLLGHWFGRPEFADHAHVLWLILFGSWLKLSAEGLYYIMYARHQDRAVWIGNLLVLGVSAVATIGAVKAFGFSGVGYAAVMSGVFIVLWRSYWVYAYKPIEKGQVA